MFTYSLAGKEKSTVLAAKHNNFCWSVMASYNRTKGYRKKITVVLLIILVSILYIFTGISKKACQLAEVRYCPFKEMKENVCMCIYKECKSTAVSPHLHMSLTKLPMDCISSLLSPKMHCRQHLETCQRCAFVSNLSCR